MADIDFARIIADVLIDEKEDQWWANDLTGDIMSTPVPALCPDCNGTERLTYVNVAGDPLSFGVCPHPNAPTIGRLLRIGEAVMRAEVRGFSDGVAVSVNGHSTKQAGPLLLMLEAVE